jgi:hypothetical protein
MHCQHGLGNVQSAEDALSATYFLLDRNGTRHEQELHFVCDDRYSKLTLRFQVAAV